MGDIYGETVGFLPRLLAFMIDAFLLSLITVPLALSLYDTWQAPLFSPITLIEIGYFMSIPLLWPGYTIGKRIMKIKIISIKHHKLDFPTMFARYVLSLLIYWITLGIGTIASVVMVITREDNRAIHDIIADTYVAFDDHNV